MAASAAAALLDELMGRDRNLDPSEKSKSIRWDSSQVCKYFVVKFCPHDLFVNTKADLGSCDKVHDETLRKEYLQAPRFQQLAFEDEFVKFCQSMLSDVEKRIKRGRQRLAINAMEAPSPKDGDEKIKSLTERINTLLEQVENLGCEGKVEEAQDVMKLYEELKRERDMLRRGSDNHWLQVSAEIAAAQEKQMEVCEVCGAFLIVGDAQQRVDDHLMGKQHMGYARIKVALEEILAQREKEKEERDKLREQEREERRKQRDKDGKSDDDIKKKSDDTASVDSKSDSRNDRRSSRDDRDRRDRDRDRDRDRYRYYDKDRGRGGRDRDRDRRDYGRSYKRSRSRDRRSSRRSRSRSRDKYRRRSRSSDRRSRSSRYRSRSRERSVRSSEVEKKRSSQEKIESKSSRSSSRDKETKPNSEGSPTNERKSPGDSDN